MQILPAGVKAPAFSLLSTPDQQLALEELRGKPVVIAMYPADWSPVCSDQMVLYNELLPTFKKAGAVLLGLSVDGVWCHKAFAESRHLGFNLLSDFEPKGQVSRAYGAYDEEHGCSGRALFVIDGDGVIAWSELSPAAVNPGADGIFAALDKLAH